ncbi:hypothetical protein [Caballeronia sp. Lep1P3]|uniref:hypothetical protein n=1 Tax=Caballeronia sp. Lep1P3 TaxID=2878150 RepID=UPI00351D71F2
MHQSVNESDRLRHCVFLDVLRPTRSTGVLSALVKGVRSSVISVRRMFYANWEVIR